MLNRQHLRSTAPHINQPYALINWVFALMITGIVLYSALYDPDRGSHALTSAYQLLTGEETVSTGLSRSFSALVRLRLDDAKELNPYGPRIFLFFVVQLILRIVILFLAYRGALHPGRRLILADAAQALVLFVVCFWPFMAYWTDMLRIG